MKFSQRQQQANNQGTENAVFNEDTEQTHSPLVFTEALMTYLDFLRCQ